MLKDFFSLSTYFIAGQYIQYHFLFEETSEFFKRYEVEDPTDEDTETLSVGMTLEDLEYYTRKRQEKITYSPGAEYDTLALPTSSAMLLNNSFLFHSVGFSYRGKAILFTGPSGIGKTTQYAQWKRLLRDEVKIISGDMPGIAVEESGRIMVHPSAWNGKERLRHEHSDPLGAIVVLEQEKENTITRLDTLHAILPVYGQMCVDRRKKELVEKAFVLEDTILRNIPVWKLSSRGDLDSARLCHDTIAGEIYGE